MFGVKILGIHVITLITIMSCSLVVFQKVRVPLLHRLVIAGSVTSLGIWFYDLVWLLGIYGFRLNRERAIVVGFLVLVLVFYRVVFDFEFFHVNRYAIMWFSAFIVAMIAMKWTGWFEYFNVWAVDTALPDPHNWLWAISKITGIFMWSTLVDLDRLP